MARELCGMFVTAAHHGGGAGSSRIAREGSLREIASRCALLGCGANHAAECLPTRRGLAKDTLRRREVDEPL